MERLRHVRPAWRVALALAALVDVLARPRPDPPVLPAQRPVSLASPRPAAVRSAAVAPRRRGAARYPARPRRVARRRHAHRR